jgi:hypothetical protein
LFAVAEVRGLQVASAFAISDSLADLVWDPQFHGPEVEAGLITLYEAALSALQADPRQTTRRRESGAAGSAQD